MTSALHAPKSLVTPSHVASSSAGAARDRRKRRRVAIAPMYSSVMLRVLNARCEPLDGHALNVSETGLAIEIDSPIAPGTPVTVEFTVAGLGRLRGRQWPSFAAAAEVVRDASQEDFPMGPYRVGLRFLRISSIVQAQISRFVISHTSPEC